VAAREEELRIILRSAATHIGKLEEQVRLTNADVASMKASGLAQQQLAETSLNHASFLALQQEASFSRERDAITALNANLSAELATANEEIKRLSSAVSHLESALESESLTSAVCEVAVARAAAACLASLEEVQLLASSTALELQIDQRRCVKGQQLIVLAADVSRLLIECNQVVATIYSDLDTQQESHAVVVHRMQTVAAELEGRCWQTSGEQRRVIRTLRRCAMAAWRARTVRLNELRRLQDNMEARRAGRVVLRVLSVLLSACSLRKMSERARRAVALARISRGFRALQSRTLLAHRQLAAIRKCNLSQFSHLRLVLILWHTQLEKRRFRLRGERIACVCGWGVEVRLVFAAFANWREVGSEWNHRVEEVKRVLLASYAQDRKATCLRWVVLSRQLVEMWRFQCRSAHLAAKTAASARVSLLGRHWVRSMYSILGQYKGLSLAAHAELLWALGELGRFTGRTGRLCLFWCWRSVCQRLRRLRVLNRRFVLRAKRAVFVRSMLKWRFVVNSIRANGKMLQIEETMGTWSLFVAFSSLFSRRDEERTELKEKLKTEERERLERLERERKQHDSQRHEVLMGISPRKGMQKRHGYCSVSQAAEGTSLGCSLEAGDGGGGTVQILFGSREREEGDKILSARQSMQKDDGGGTVQYTPHPPPSPPLSARQSMLQGSSQLLFPSSLTGAPAGVLRSMLRSNEGTGSSRGGRGEDGRGEKGGGGVNRALFHSRRAFASWRSAFDQFSHTLTRIHRIHSDLVLLADTNNCGVWFCCQFAPQRSPTPSIHTLPPLLLQWLAPCFNNWEEEADATTEEGGVSAEDGGAMGGGEKGEQNAAAVAGFAVVRRRSSWLRNGVTISWRRRLSRAAREERWATLDDLDDFCASYSPHGQSPAKTSQAGAEAGGAGDSSLCSHRAIGDERGGGRSSSGADRHVGGDWSLVLRHEAANMLGASRQKRHMAGMRVGGVSCNSYNGFRYEGSSYSYKGALPWWAARALRVGFSALWQHAMCSMLARVGRWRASVLLVTDHWREWTQHVRASAVYRAVLRRIESHSLAATMGGVYASSANCGRRAFLAWSILSSLNHSSRCV
jgi:hypothetical protein